MIESYPLRWPAGKPRAANPTYSQFGDRSIGTASDVLGNEVRRLDGRDMIISSNLRLRQDGLPYANQAQPQDRGVAVYFTYKGRQMCFACDRWDKIQDNIYAIALTVEALRGIGRWGSGDMVEQAFTGFAALPDPMDPYKIVGVPVGSPWQDITRAYREKAKMRHVDAGGSHSAMVELNEAYAKLKEKYKDVA